MALRTVSQWRTMSNLFRLVMSAPFIFSCCSCTFFYLLFVYHVAAAYVSLECYAAVIVILECYDTDSLRLFLDLTQWASYSLGCHVLHQYLLWPLYLLIFLSVFSAVQNVHEASRAHTLPKSCPTPLLNLLPPPPRLACRGSYLQEGLPHA